MLKKLLKGMKVTIVNIEHQQSYFSVEAHEDMKDLNEDLTNYICGLHTEPSLSNGRYIQFIMTPSEKEEKRVRAFMQGVNAIAYFYTDIFDGERVEKHSPYMNSPIFWKARDEIDRLEGKKKKYK